eukprot:COSAG01_NODE_1978_length_8747_cov_87.182007_14_plen_58_part_00
MIDYSSATRSRLAAGSVAASSVSELGDTMWANLGYHSHAKRGQIRRFVEVTAILYCL